MTRKTMLIAAAIIVLGIIPSTTFMHKEEFKVVINSIKEAYEYTDKIMNADPSYKFKSSVYGMIEDSPINDAVVAEGIDVLPYFESALENANVYGSTEFMMAVIMLDIVQYGDETSSANWSARSSTNTYIKNLV